MTCIVAIEDNGKVYFGGDTYFGDPEKGDVDICDTDKVYKIGKVLIGVCGNVKCEQIFEECAKEHLADLSINRDFIKDVFSPIVLKRMNDNVILGSTEQNSVIMPDSSSFLIGIDGQILLFQDDFSVVRSKKKYASIGSGAPYALGALDILIGMDLAPREKIKLALKAAEKNCAWVRSPFTIISK